MRTLIDIPDDLLPRVDAIRRSLDIAETARKNELLAERRSHRQRISELKREIVLSAPDIAEIKNTLKKKGYKAAEQLRLELLKKAEEERNAKLAEIPDLPSGPIYKKPSRHRVYVEALIAGMAIVEKKYAVERS
jgi:hypothetical protein